MVWPCKQDASEKTSNSTRKKSEENIYFGITHLDRSIALRILVGIAENFTHIYKRKTGNKKHNYETCINSYKLFKMLNQIFA